MPEQHPRLISLDFFRGLTIFAMIWVNMPGNWSQVPHWMEHAQWNGVHFPDFIFPFFLLMVGCSLALSLAKFKDQEKGPVLRRIYKRGLLLIGIGWLIHVFPFANWGDFFQGKAELSQSLWPSRIPGVLQRIGLCILLAAPALLYLRPKQLSLLTLFCLILYPSILYLYAPQAPYALEHNAVSWLDQKLLGSQYLWDKEHGFDPEGLLSTLGSLCTVWIGALIGLKLRISGSKSLGQWFYLGLSMALCGLCLHPFIPLNKSLWSSSYVLLTAGTGIVLFAGLIWALDLKQLRLPGQRAWIALGKNALLAYIISEMWTMLLWQALILPSPDGSWCDGYKGLYLWGFASWAGEFWGSIAFSAAHCIALCLLMMALDRKKIYLKI